MNHQVSSASDIEIVEAIVAGQVNAFEHLVERYQKYVFKIVGRHVPPYQVEETAHEVFVRLYQSLDRFGGQGNFSQWLATIAVRTCYDFWREKYRSREHSMSSLSPEKVDTMRRIIAEESCDSFHNKDIQEEAKELLDWALGHFSPEDRMVLELVYLEELSGREAADLLGWSVANVKIRSFRARKKLHKLMQKFM